jgi:exopolysaccharide production protein ExoZ
MIWSIQVLRFVAALMVVYIHAVTIAFNATGSVGILPFRFATIGHIGVDIFFVISGLIIAKIAPGRTPSEFTLSRITRIVPMYFLFTVATIVLSIDISSFSWRDTVASFLFWPATDKMTLPALAGGWSLCFEMLFYACTALVLVNLRWLFIIIGGYGVALMVYAPIPIMQFVGNPLILEFLLGVAIANAPNWRPGIWGLPLGAICFFGAGLAGIAPTNNAMDLLLGHEGLRRVIIFGFPSAMIVYGTLQIKARESVWTYLGDASYTLYLSHPIVMLPLLALWQKFPVPANLGIFICISISLIVAWRMHEVVEKPMLALFKRQRLQHRKITSRTSE